MTGPALSRSAAVPAGAPTGAPTGPAGSGGAIPEPRTPPPARAPKVVFAGFDGLRAIAALLVVVVHTAFPAGLTSTSRVGPYTARGEIGVAVFFLISGFLLYRPFVAARFAGGPPAGAAGYLVRRFMRIVPLYWVALAVTLNVVSDDRVGVHGFPGMLQTAFFIQGYQEKWAIQGLTQAWTLNVEVAFYLAVPLYAALVRGPLARRLRPQPSTQLKAELGALAVTFVAAKIVHYLVIPSQASWASGWNVWLPVWWDLFAMGMALAAVSAWYSQQGRSPRWADWPGSGTACWAVAAFFYWVSSTRINLPLVPIFEATRAQDMDKHLFYGLFGLFLLLPAVFGRSDRGWVRPLLASRPLAFLGAISYGIYLWHSAVIDLVLEHSGWKMWKIPYLPFLAVVLTLTVAVSTVTHFLIEKPCITLSRDWARRADAWAARRSGRSGRSGGSGRAGGSGSDGPADGAPPVLGESPTLPLATRTASTRNTPARTAPARNAPARPGSGRDGDDWTGRVPIEPGRYGPDRARPDRYGEDSSPPR